MIHVRGPDFSLLEATGTSSACLIPSSPVISTNTFLSQSSALWTKVVSTRPPSLRRRCVPTRVVRIAHHCPTRPSRHPENTADFRTVSDVVRDRASRANEARQSLNSYTVDVRNSAMRLSSKNLVSASLTFVSPGSIFRRKSPSCVRGGTHTSTESARVVSDQVLHVSQPPTHSTSGFQQPCRKKCASTDFAPGPMAAHLTIP